MNNPFRCLSKLPVGPILNAIGVAFFVAAWFCYVLL